MEEIIEDEAFIQLKSSLNQAQQEFPPKMVNECLDSLFQFLECLPEEITPGSQYPSNLTNWSDFSFIENPEKLRCLDSVSSQMEIVLSRYMIAACITKILSTVDISPKVDEYFSKFTQGTTPDDFLKVFLEAKEIFDEVEVTPELEETFSKLILCRKLLE